MKRLYKGIIVMAAGLFLLSAPASAGKPFGVGRLPENALLTIGKDFKGRGVVESTVSSGRRDTTYNVVFTNGDAVEFDSRGNWTEIHCSHSSVPSSLVPDDIGRYVASHYGNSPVKDMMRAGDMYRLILANGEDVVFYNDFDGDM